jgi:hypothetical protein
MTNPKSIVFEHFDLKDIFFTKILANNPTFQSFEEYEIGTASYVRVWNLLLSNYIRELKSQMSSRLFEQTQLPRDISVNDWSE